jgi:cytochrome c oxidase subunit 3
VTYVATMNHKLPDSAEESPQPLHPELEAQHGTAYVGMLVFLGSWAVMFISFFFAFLLYRVRATPWPPPSVAAVPLWLPGVSTAVILASSVVLDRGAAQELMPPLVMTLVLALVFVGLQTALWFTVANEGVTLQTDHFAGHFYILTIFHALHVLVGLGLVTSMLPKALKGPNPSLAISMRLTCMFWHFVGVAWLMIFLLLFIL